MTGPAAWQVAPAHSKDFGPRARMGAVDRRALLSGIALALLAVPSVGGQAPPSLSPAPAHQPLASPDWAAYEQREELGEPGGLVGAVRVLRFVQVSDAHILDDDAPYPLRQENLDPVGPPVNAAQRPQEEFTDEVLDSVVREINRLHGADPLQFVLNTGDNIDNDLENELLRFIDLYDGTSTTVGPLSGFPCQPDGQSTSTTDASQDVTDTCTSLPAALAEDHPGLSADLPWLSAFGNHDALIQGNVNIAPSFQDIAETVGRRFIHQTEYVAMHFEGASSCSGSPGVPGGSAADDFGHGYALAGDRLCDDDPDNDGYYAFSVGAVRFVVLDTVNDDFVTANGNLQGAFNPQTMTGADIIGGYAEGALDPAQAAWLEEELAAHATSLVVLVSHHTVNSMFSSLAEGYCQEGAGCLDDLLTASGYKTGPELAEELAQKPNVVAWFGGHTHRHRIEPKGAGGFCQAIEDPECRYDSGFWNVESSSLIDWPQEARVVELWRTADGAKAFWRLTAFTHGFAPSRELEQTDPQREPAAAGGPGDRDVLLWFDVPPGIVLDPLPEAPRHWEVRLVSGDGTVGQALPVTIAVRDALHPDTEVPSLLSATWTVGHGATDGTDLFMVDVPAGTPMTSGFGGNQTLFSGNFTPTAAVTHYATVELRDGERVLATQLLSLAVAPAADPPEKDTPGFAVALGLAALAFALARTKTR